MKNWTSAIFPITTLGVLAALSFWLSRATDIEEEKNDGKNRHDPDYIITGMTLKKLDRDGRLKYTLTADDLTHFPDDDSTEVTKPKLVYLNARKPTLTMQSRMANVTSDGEIVYMYDDVRIKRDATPLRAELLGFMPDLTINTEEETAFTNNPVLFTRGTSWLTGIGMNIDNRTETYVLQSQARGQFESRKAKAKP